MRKELQTLQRALPLTVMGKDSSESKTGTKSESMDLRSYQSGNLKKDVIMERLRQEGFRVTRQRKLLIEIILKENCSCCKEVYVLASAKDPGIGMATIYRTVDALEQVGALKRRGSYQLCSQGKRPCKCCLVELEDSSVVELDYASMEKVMEKGMKSCGFSKDMKIKGITWMPD